MEMLRYRLFQEIRNHSFDAESPIALIIRAMELIDCERYDEESKHRILMMTIQSFASKDPLFAEDNYIIPLSCIQKIKIMLDQKLVEETILMLDGVAKGKRLQKPTSMFYNYAASIGSSFSTIGSYITMPYYYYMQTSPTTTKQEETIVKKVSEQEETKTSDNMSQEKLIPQVIVDQNITEEIIVTIDNKEESDKDQSVLKEESKEESDKDQSVLKEESKEESDKDQSVPEEESKQEGGELTTIFDQLIENYTASVELDLDID